MIVWTNPKVMFRFLTVAVAFCYLSSAFSSIREPSSTFAPNRDVQSSDILKQHRSCWSPNRVPSRLNLSRETQSTENQEERKIDEVSLLEQSTTNVDESNKKTIAGGTFLIGLASSIIGAKMDILRGPLDPVSGVYASYSDSMILQDSGITILAAILAYALVKTIGLGFEKNVFDAKVARKLSHVLSAPLYIFVWPLFSAADGARFFAGVVTLTNAVRLYIAGTGGDSKLANSVSRSGDKSEALGGPFIYVCLFQLFLLCFWRSSVVGVVAMSTMAAGDGMADLVGRRWGRENKWWFSDSKSIAGTVAFAIAASFTSFGLVQWLVATGCLTTSLAVSDVALRIVGISVACALIELLPIGDDNYNVPISAAILSAVLLN